MTKKKRKSVLLAGTIAVVMGIGAGSSMVYAEDYGEEAYVEVNQEIEAVSEDDQQNAVVTDETSQTTTDGEGVESDADLAKARESETGEAASWKDKLQEGSYLNYFGHVQTYGDLTYVSDGEDFGTTGESKRLEALSIFKGSAIQDFEGDIVYRAHVQTYGSQDWKSSGERMGTTGEGKRIEAIQMYLTGELAEYFDIYYCLHAQTFGWTKWVKGSEDDSAWCGTSGLSKRVEAVKICLVAKDGGTIPEDLHGAMVDYSYLTPDSLGSISYSGHQQTYGDLGPAYQGENLGILGESKRLEALSVSLETGALSGSVRYRTHVQTYGWQDWVSDGTLSGTTGEGKRLEAVQIELEGDIARYYDIYYSVHIQSFGWLGWAKNGEMAGSEGLAKRLETIQIRLVPKGGQAPGSTENAYINRQNRGISNVLGISAASIVMNLQSHVNDNFYLGTRYADDIDDGRSPNGDVSFNGYPGMNCTGFVWYVLQSVGASGNTVPNMQGASWCAGGWVSWQRIHASQIPTYDFSNKWEMLESGVLEKGDIIWIWNENEGGKSGLSGTHHIGFFWGDTSDEDLFWHSSPYGGNQISPINGLSDNVSYTVMKL